MTGCLTGFFGASCPIESASENGSHCTVTTDYLLIYWTSFVLPFSFKTPDRLFHKKKKKKTYQPITVD